MIVEKALVQFLLELEAAVAEVLSQLFQSNNTDPTPGVIGAATVETDTGPVKAAEISGGCGLWWAPVAFVC